VLNVRPVLLRQPRHHHRPPARRRPRPGTRSSAPDGMGEARGVGVRPAEVEALGEDDDFAPLPPRAGDAVARPGEVLCGRAGPDEDLTHADADRAAGGRRTRLAGRGAPRGRLRRRPRSRGNDDASWRPPPATCARVFVAPTRSRSAVTTFVVAASAVPASPGCLPPTAIVKRPGSTMRRPSFPTSENARPSRVKAHGALLSGLSAETRLEALDAASSQRHPECRRPPTSVT